MENQLINAAKVKLQQHKSQGETSNLSIFEVARLMDVVTFGVTDTTEVNTPIFFSFSKN